MFLLNLEGLFEILGENYYSKQNKRFFNSNFSKFSTDHRITDIIRQGNV